MNMDLRHSQRLEQTLTPQLVMNLKLLQLPTMELEGLISAELEQNPALEVVGDSPEGGVSRNGEATESTQPEMEMSAVKTTGKETAGFPLFNPSEEFSFDELLPTEGWALESTTEEYDTDPFELAVSPIKTLREVLLPKLLVELGEEDRGVAEEIIEWLNEDGFLTISAEEIAEKLGVEMHRVQRVLATLARIPPGGFGSPDVRSALLVQLELKGAGEDTLEWLIVRDGWELVKRKDILGLASTFNVSEDEVRSAIGRILELEPRPARQLTTPGVNYITPDFSVEWQGDKLVVVMREENIPTLRVAHRFLEMLRSPASFSKEELNFAREKVSRAVMFLKAIESRRSLLRRLMEFVLKKQEGFFLKGAEHLKPATLLEAGKTLGVHPSTISRAIKGKYLECSYGIFPLKFFFKLGTGESSRESVKEKIRVLIEGEDKNNPLTDEEIGAKLREEGINISRRTVAKYREELGILAANKRKGFR